VVARNNDILKQLVLEAKREYERDAINKVHVYLADTFVYLRYYGCTSTQLCLTGLMAVGAGTEPARNAL
jgi:hypothetical protein